MNFCNNPFSILIEKEKKFFIIQKFLIYQKSKKKIPFQICSKNGLNISV